MSFLQDNALFTNSFKRYHSNAALGHWVEVCGYWDKDGYEESFSSFKHSSVSFTPCSLVFVTAENFRELDVTLTVVVKTCKRKKDTYGNEEYTESTQFGSTLKKPVYEADTTKTLNITIPAWERPGVAYRIGTDTTVYEIVSVTADIQGDGYGAGYIYALASVGSKMVYGLSFNRLMTDLQTISHGIFASPPFCPLCEGTGVINTTEVCPQCNGFTYSGRGAIEYLMKRHGDEVGVGQDEDRTFDRFQHEVWMQKWWCTPTVTQIKRMFAFFCDIEDSEIEIDERYDDHEPAWHLLLPTGMGPNTQFNWENTADVAALKLLMESVTPAGVTSYLTFYSNEFGTTYGYVSTDITIGALDITVTPYPIGQFGAEWGSDFMFPSSGFGFPYEEPPLSNGMWFCTQARRGWPTSEFSGEYLW